MHKGPIAGAMLFVFCVTSAVSAQWCRRVGATAPCSVLRNDSIVFIGTVLSITPEQRSYTTPENTKLYYPGTVVKFRIDEIIAGALGTEVELAAGDAADYRFEAGRTYLVDALERGGEIVAERCSLTAPIEHADHLLEQLRRIIHGKSPASIYGTLIQRDDYPYTGKDPSPVRTLRDIVVRLRSTEHEFSTKTEGDGSFSFYDLPAGKYVASADLAQGYVIQSERGLNLFTIEKGACLLDNLTAIPNGSVRGLIADADGIPIQHAEVKLTTPLTKVWQDAEQNSKSEPLFLLKYTDEEGRFEFTQLPDGKFKLEASSELPVRHRTPFRPFKRTIHIAGGNGVDIGVVSLQKWKDQYTARFLVLWNDGTPAKGAAVRYEGTADSSENEKDVDVDGRVSLQFLSEYQYEVYGSVWCKDRNWVESKPLTIKHAGDFNLILDGSKCEPAEY